MAVLFALTLTSQTILASQYDILDPRYNGATESVASTDSDPWGEPNNGVPQIETTNINNIMIFFDTAKLYVFYFLMDNIYVPQTYFIINQDILKDNNSTQNHNIISDNEDNEENTSTSRPKKD
ncbi:MAG: hypothetical protein ACOYVF_06155 [Candidatus Zixiibacteriota bacterium]